MKKFNAFITYHKPKSLTYYIDIYDSNHEYNPKRHPKHVAWRKYDNINSYLEPVQFKSISVSSKTKEKALALLLSFLV